MVATSLIPLVNNFPEIFAFIIGFSFTVWTKKAAKKVRKQVTECLQNLYQSVGIQGAFATLITSTKVFSLIICKNSLTTPLKRSFT